LPRCFQASAGKLALGGDTIRVKTYGELVTSIINPSHVLAVKYQQQLTDAKESPMPHAFTTCPPNRGKAT
jgi:hypothetical protein